jgi:hypothetical protein
VREDVNHFSPQRRQDAKTRGKLEKLTLRLRDLATWRKNLAWAGRKARHKCAITIDRHLF